MSPSKYVHEAARICKEYVAKHHHKCYILLKREMNPFAMSYCQELDVSLILVPDKASYYKSLIGVMRWMVKIRCTDINYEVSLLSSHLTMPRQGHFEAMICSMGYLNLRNNSRLTFNPSHPIIDWSNFCECDWADFYEGAVEPISPNAPPSKGKELDPFIFVDSNHADTSRLGS